MRRINLALQGGGAHGAFTWGVMHRLMSDRRLFIDGLSGTSAGAMNAVVFADGFLKGRRQGAIDALETFWRRVSRSAHASAMFRPPELPNRPNNWNLDASPSYVMMDLLTRLLSPYDLNPLDVNPLRHILDELIDYEALRARDDLHVFVSASNVRTCKPRVFRTSELSTQVLLATSCLPMMFQTVEIDGEPYWDGGYLGNPAIHPLIHECISNDVIIVQINPMNRPDIPRSAKEIINRINEMSFNSSLVREMRGIATVSRFVEDGLLTNTNYDRVNFHLIEAEVELGQLGASSKLNTDWKFLKHLHDLGYRTTERWLAENFDKLQVCSTLDVFERFT
ncbi:MAG: patatin-like phospholipase family protein [Alphaproteobacteria bacterium]|nr:patatin-like phospholipase family protein [Alphaproteobacteria bacterium]